MTSAIPRTGEIDLRRAIASATPESIPALCDYIEHLPSEVDLCLPDSDQNTLLHYAASHGHEAVMPSIWARLPKGANPNPPDSRGDTPLHLAAVLGHVGAVHTISKHLLLAKADLNPSNRRGRTPLFLAVQRGVLYSGVEDIISAIYEYPPRTTNLNSPGQDGTTPLHLAAEIGEETSARAILDHLPPGADPNPPDEEGRTPLHLASQVPHASTARAILEHLPIRAFLVRDKFGTAPLHIAAELSDEIFIRTKLEQLPAESLALPDQYGRTPLHLAVCRRDDGKVVELFVDAIKKTGQMQILWIKSKKDRRWTARQFASPQSPAAAILAEAEKSAIQEVVQEYIFPKQQCAAKLSELITDYAV